MMIEQKLSQLQYKRIGKPSNVAEKELAAVEFGLSKTLPKIYRDFLLEAKAPIRFNVDVRFTTLDPCPWAGEEGTLDIVEFYGLKRGRSSLRTAIETYSDQIPPYVIPIAESSGGNQVCIGISGKAKGKVYFWDHESDDDSKEEHHRISPDLYLIASTFRNFVNELKERPEEPWDDDDEGGVIWLTDEFDTKDQCDSFVTQLSNEMGRFDLFWQGIRGIFAGLFLLTICLSQLMFGWIGAALWLRLAFGIAGLLIAVPLIVAGFIYMCAGLTGDVDTRIAPRIFRRK